MRGSIGVDVVVVDDDEGEKKRRGRGKEGNEGRPPPLLTKKKKRKITSTLCPGSVLAELLGSCICNYFRETCAPPPFFLLSD